MKVDLRLNKSISSLVDQHRGEMSVQAYINLILKQTLQSQQCDTSSCRDDNSNNTVKIDKPDC